MILSIVALTNVDDAAVMGRDHVAGLAEKPSGTCVETDHNAAMGIRVVRPHQWAGRCPRKRKDRRVLSPDEALTLRADIREQSFEDVVGGHGNCDWYIEGIVEVLRT